MHVKSLMLSVALAAVTPWAGGALAWEIRLNVEEHWCQPGVRHVSGGVPLLVGQARETSQLRLAVKGRDGKLSAVPAQFRVLARWWRADHSIRWVLVDFVTSFQGSDTKVFYLTDEKLQLPEPKHKLTVTETDDAVVVNTGPAEFAMSRKRFAFLDRAVVNGVDLLEASPDLGSVLEDTHGEKYYSSEGTKSVEVIEKGPMRVCVRARGQHRARQGRGYSKGMYGYDCFVNFYVGSSAVYVDLILGNNPPKSVGAPTFEDASLLMRLKGGARGYRLYGAGPLDGELGGGESVCLYQDSNGAETWRACQGYSGPGPGGANFPPDKTVSFRGYRVLRRAAGREEPITDGDQARGLAHLFNERGGVVVETKDFWQQFPKAVEVGADGALRLAVFPRECKVPHYLEDAGGKGHEIFLLFYAKGKGTGYAADPAGRPWPHVFADTWNYPVLPRPAAEHIAAAGALSDVGPFSVPAAGFEDYPYEIFHRRMFMPDPYWGNRYGWQVYGSSWQAFGGHSTKGARQPIKEDNYLYRWYVTGRRNWLTAGLRRSRNFRDVRCYRIEDQNPFGFKSWAAFRKANQSEQYTSRPQPKDAEIKKYSQGKWWRNPWELPNPSHMTLDLLYDRYLLLGDARAFENMRVVAGHGGNYAAYTQPQVHRLTGWSWRALERYWELTGEKEAYECLMDTLKNYEKLIGKTPLACGGHGGSWFTQIFSRAVAMTALHTGDKRAIDLCKTLAVGKEKNAGYFNTLFAVLYHLTGEQKYKEAVLRKSSGGRSLLSAVGYWPACSHWLLTQPPKGK